MPSTSSRCSCSREVRSVTQKARRARVESCGFGRSASTSHEALPSLGRLWRGPRMDLAGMAAAGTGGLLDGDGGTSGEKQSSESYQQVVKSTRARVVVASRAREWGHIAGSNFMYSASTRRGRQGRGDERGQRRTVQQGERERAAGSQRRRQSSQSRGWRRRMTWFLAWNWDPGAVDQELQSVSKGGQQPSPASRARQGGRRRVRTSTGGWAEGHGHGHGGITVWGWARGLPPMPAMSPGQPVDMGTQGAQADSGSRASLPRPNRRAASAAWDARVPAASQTLFPMILVALALLACLLACYDPLSLP